MKRLFRAPTSHSLRYSLLAILGSLAGAGCSDDGGVDEPLDSTNFTVCSENEVLIDGETSNQVEGYSFQNMNLELIHNEALRRTAQLEQVETCEDARLLVQARRKLENAQSSEEQSSDEEPEEGTAGLGEVLVDGPPRYLDRASGAVLHGIEAPYSKSVRLWMRETLLSDDVRTCSGVLIGPRTLLTSAHCFAPRFTNIGDGSRKSYPIVVKQTQVDRPNRPRWSLTNNDDGALYTGQWEFADVWVFDEWKGDGYATNDLAIVQVDHTWRHTSSSDYNRIFDDRLSDTNKKVAFQGYGPEARNGSGSGVERWGYATLDKIRTHYFGDNNSTYKLCFGDSGGPAWVHDPRASRTYVAGLASRGDEADGDCAAANSYQYWTRVLGGQGGRLAWLESTAGIDCSRHYDSSLGSYYYKCW